MAKMSTRTCIIKRAHIFTPTPYQRGEESLLFYNVAWDDEDGKFKRATSKYPPTLYPLSGDVSRLAEVFRQADALNVPRDVLFQGNPATLTLLELDDALRLQGVAIDAGMLESTLAKRAYELASGGLS